jgi:hypothetical protein
VLVWSFYEKPDADAFVRECGQLFLGEPDDASAGGRLERLQRGLRDGRPHLIVLDGLERVQAEAGTDHVRGELEDHTLRLLLQAIAAGLGRTRALVTSRFPLTDLRDWQRRSVVETTLDDLSADAARQVLRGWGVRGEDTQLDDVSASVGQHALSVAVIGSYLSHFEDGRIEAAATLQLDAAAGDDPKAAKLARVLGFYAERLPAEERELLARLSVFPRGITLDVLGTLVDAGGQVAGVLVNAKPTLTRLLVRLRDRGLVFRYAATDGMLTWSAHPFVRERFGNLLECPMEAVFDAVARRLGEGLERRPDKRPQATAMLDRYEQMIEAIRLAGREAEAFDLYWYGLGGGVYLDKLGEYGRGYRILRGFLPTWSALKGFGAGLTPRTQSLGLSELGDMAQSLGRLQEAAEIRREDDTRKRALDEPRETSIGLQNTCQLLLNLGRLGEAFTAAAEALTEAERTQDDGLRRGSLSRRAATQHRLGNIAAARDDFAAAALETGWRAGSGYYYAQHQLQLGDITACRAITGAGLSMARRDGWHSEIPAWHAILARIALAEGWDANRHIDEIRAWTARTGSMNLILEAHELAARSALARGDLYTARAEADGGLRQARLCGYRLRQINLLVTLSAIDLAWPDALKAIQAAREALDLAAHPDCQYAWGEADAAQVWGEAYFANHEPALAQRAFTRALEVRKRIGHPGVADTERWLAMAGD